MARRCLLALLLVLAGCRPNGPAAPHGRAEPPRPREVRGFRFVPDAVLLITGGTNGMLEVCNCAGPMPGGLARRSGLVRSYRAAFPNTCLLDLGDAFWVEPNDLRNEFLLTGYGQIGYDALVLADQEWAASTDRLRSLLAGTDLPYLATTVRADGLPLREVVTRQWPAAKLAVVADVPPEAFRFVPEARREQLRFRPRAELADRVRRLKQAGCVVVLVAHMGEEVLPEAAEAVAADLILRGHTQRSEAGVRRVAGKPVVKVGGHETVGVVALKIDAGRLVDLDYRVELVDTSWPLDRRLIQTYQAYAHAAMRQALDAERTEGLAYVASSACGKCHRVQHAAWKRSPHAGAYRTLGRVRETGNPNCLMCHTSGFGTKHGFYTIDKTPDLAGVNCQDCHRVSLEEHRQDILTKPRRPRRVGKDVCTTCHTPVTDPRFDLDKRRRKIRCPHAPVPPELLIGH